MFTIKKIFINITRNKARSLILAAFSFLTVSFAGIYFGNLEQNQNLLAALGEKLPVTAAVTNSTGDRLTGLDITEKRVELFRELGLKDYVITAESYGNIGFGPENTEQRASVHLTGINTVSSMAAWKPEFSLEQAQVESILSGEENPETIFTQDRENNTMPEQASDQNLANAMPNPAQANQDANPIGLCLLNESFVQERGLSWQAGDVLDINLYRALYDEFDGVSGFVEITSAELKVAGFYRTAPENALEAADLVCPLSWLAGQYREAGSGLLYSSAKGTVENPLALNVLKSKAEKAKFPQVDIQSVGGRPGNALVIDDLFFIRTASQLKSSIHLLKLFLAPLLLLVTGISALVSFFAMCHRKREIYLERCMGRERAAIAAELVGENVVLSLLGGGAALLFTEGTHGPVILAAFLGIRIVTTLAPAVRLTMENPMKIF